MGSRRLAFTLVELLVVIAIMGILLMLLLPAINAAREAGRKSSCMSNMKQIGVALSAYHEANKKFPPGEYYHGYNAYGDDEDLTRDMTTGKANNLLKSSNWSFFVFLLPYLDGIVAYNSLDFSLGPGSESTRPGKPSCGNLAVALTSYAVMACPSNPSNRRRVDQDVYSDGLSKILVMASTSYKAIAGSHLESLRFMSPEYPGVLPLYPPGLTASEYAPLHPDGAIYPTSQTRVQDLLDGASYTILLTESIEGDLSAWANGPEVMVYTLNPTPTIAFDNTYSRVVGSNVSGQFWHPVGFNGKFGGDAPNYSIRTCIACDYTKPPDQGQYLPAFEVVADSYQPYLKKLCGPSSGHPTQVNHLFGDGSVKSISKQIDPAAMMFISTRAGHDPTPPPIFSQ